MRCQDCGYVALSSDDFLSHATPDKDLGPVEELAEQSRGGVKPMAKMSEQARAEYMAERRQWRIERGLPPTRQPS